MAAACRVAHFLQVLHHGQPTKPLNLRPNRSDIRAHGVHGLLEGRGSDLCHRPMSIRHTKILVRAAPETWINQSAWIRNETLTTYRERHPWLYSLLPLACLTLERPDAVFECLDQVADLRPELTCYARSRESLGVAAEGLLDEGETMLVFVTSTFGVNSWRNELSNPTFPAYPRDFDQGRFTNPNSPWIPHQ